MPSALVLLCPRMGSVSSGSVLGAGCAARMVMVWLVRRLPFGAAVAHGLASGLVGAALAAAAAAWFHAAVLVVLAAG